MKELFIFLNEFYLDNKSIVTTTLILRTLSSLIKTNITPYILAELFNNIKEKENLKKSLTQLYVLWISSGLIQSMSIYYKNTFDIKLITYIIKRIVKSYLIKYEIENSIPNVAILLDRIMTLKNGLEDSIELITVNFIPKLLAIIISCIQFFFINLHLGSAILICMIVQYYIYIHNNNNCIIKGVDEYHKKDKLYEYIEEIFNNIGIIQSTNNAYTLEIKNVENNISTYVNAKSINSKCINNRQYLGYFINIIIFFVIIFAIYQLNTKSRLDNSNTLKSIFLLIGLFDNLNDFAFDIPELTRRISHLKNLELTMKDILKYKNFETEHDIKISNFDIIFDKVSFGYNKKNMLFNDLSIIIPQNNIITLWGPSGQGKTTFIKLIFGILKPDKGTIKIDNIDSDNFYKLRNYISYIEQNTNNLFNRTIFENIIYGHEYDSYTKDILKNNIKNIIDNFELYSIFENMDKNKIKWSFLDNNVGKLGSKLSGGQKKIIYLLKMYINEKSKILILDEPTNGLDNITKNKIINFFYELKKVGKTLLIISHDNEVKNIGDKILQFNINKNPEFIIP